MTSGTTRVEVRETPEILSIRKRDGQVGTRSGSSTIATAVHGHERATRPIVPRAVEMPRLTRADDAV